MEKQNFISKTNKNKIKVARKTVVFIFVLAITTIVQTFI